MSKTVEDVQLNSASKCTGPPTPSPSEGARVVFEEAHAPLYTIGDNPAFGSKYICWRTGGYGEFANLLRGKGYTVSTIDPGTLITDSMLASVDVLVIVAPQKGYLPSEIDAIKSWVDGGGSLLLISEVFCFGRVSGEIADRFGVKYGHKILIDLDNRVTFLPFCFYLDGSNIKPHEITENVFRIEVYGAGGIVEHSANSIPLLVTDDDGTAWLMCRRCLTTEMPLMVAIDYSESGGGRFVTITDTNLWGSVWDFDCDGDLNFYDSDNEILAVNTINWLAESSIVNNPPSIKGVELNTSMIYRGEGLGIKVFATDPEDGLDITVSGSIFDPSDNLVTTLDDRTLVDDYFETSWRSSFDDPVGEYRVDILVMDKEGAKAISSKTFQVENNLPHIAEIQLSSETIYRGNSLTISVFADDFEDNTNLIIQGEVFYPNGTTIILDQWIFVDNHFETEWFSTLKDPTGSYEIQILVTDQNDGSITGSKTFYVQNNPPQIYGVDLNSPIYRGDELIISVFASDLEDDLDLSVVGMIYGPYGSLIATLNDWKLVDNDHFEASWSPSYGDHFGEYAIHILVTDNDGEAAVVVSGFQVENNLPYITNVIADPAQIYQGQGLKIHVYAGDLEDGYDILIRADIYGPDGSQIAFLDVDEWAFNDDGEYFVASWISSTSASTGSYDISINVNDSDLGAVSETYLNVFSIKSLIPQSVPTGGEGVIFVLSALGIASIIGIGGGAAIFYSKKIAEISLK